jgi:hypothetical protein
MSDRDDERDLAIDPPDNQGGGAKDEASASLQGEESKIDPPSNDGGN